MAAARGDAALQPARVLADLRELRELTSNEHGAQRLCWTPTWARAREWFQDNLAGLPVESELDPAGNRWITLRGADERSVVLGGHIDSVPNGGWLDGALGLLAGLEVLRAAAADGTPALTLKLVDWADEEGVRFGYDSLGSSAASGTLDLERARTLHDRDGAALPDVVRRYGVELDRMPEARAWLAGAVGYLELHIEQGPVLERLGLPLATVVGTVGVERHVVRFTGQSAHAGSTPMEGRRDALAAAARLALAVREPAVAAGGLATVGRCVAVAGIATAVAGEAELTLDQRHLDAGTLADLLAQARRAAEQIAAEERVSVEWSRLWGIAPIDFDPDLIAAVDAAVADVAGQSHRLPSGPLHDAAEVARAGVPAAMLFVQSLRGLSHAKEEDTRPEHIELSVRALASATRRVIGSVTSKDRSGDGRRAGTGPSP